MELTKEHFDQSLKGLVTKEHFDQVVAGLATKEQIEDLARMTSRGFDDVLERLDVTTQIKTFERKFQKLEEALHIKL